MVKKLLTCEYLDCLVEQFELRFAKLHGLLGDLHHWDHKEIDEPLEERLISKYDSQCIYN